ncbi:G2/M phase-specific E3 ubiquitin-protein ligase-like [Corticium candelabrum]|uniref:G2/M phase-specific E3 ubiquitin-protein ligase-like n=1 Tax=Corticium candelabrum TaxID=121492 RepID=UPI002E252B74|nr:G2/M phase-specific E3 ubiquitin-protein ligase-like [Corticium candelabrum]
MQRVNPSLDSRSSRKHYCLFCNSNVDDEFNLGVFFVSKYRRRWTAAHHHCLLFAAGLKQAGKDSDGFAGFLLPDVMDEYRRCRRLRCAYCKKNGAASGCVMRSCRQVFHYTCGMTGGSLFQFYGSFH